MFGFVAVNGGVSLRYGGRTEHRVVCPVAPRNGRHSKVANSSIVLNGHVWSRLSQYRPHTKTKGVVNHWVCSSTDCNPVAGV